jgi:hypothetical protein
MELQLKPLFIVYFVCFFCYMVGKAFYELFQPLFAKAKRRVRFFIRYHYHTSL